VQRGRQLRRHDRQLPASDSMHFLELQRHVDLLTELRAAERALRRCKRVHLCGRVRWCGALHRNAFAARRMLSQR
jgi:hypothetical protein